MKLFNKGVHIKDISIKTVILIAFIVILVVTIGTIGYITYSNWMDSIDKTIKQSADILNKQIISEIDALVLNAKSLNTVNKEFIESGIVDINNGANQELLFVKALSSFNYEEIYSFSYGTELGEYYGARRNQDNVIEIMRNNEQTGGNTYYYSINEDLTAGALVLDAGKFDSRSRPWYTEAKKTNGMVFSPIYKHFILDDLAISASIPIYNKDKQIQGVLGSHINLSRINHYLEEVVADKSGYAIIAEKESGKLIANSLNISNFKTDQDGSLLRISINEIDNRAIQESYKSYLENECDNYTVNYEDENLYIKLIEYQDKGLDWIIITVLPDGLMVVPVKYNVKIVLVLALLAICISTIVFFTLTKKYIEPIYSLIQTQEKFAKGDLLQRARIVRNDEIGLVGNSFNNMANTIYELINTLEEKVQERTSDLNLSNKALIDNKDHLELILNSTAEGIYGVDLNDNCTFINASGVSILGYDQQYELIGKNMHLLIHHSYKDGVWMPIEDCNLSKALKKGTEVHENNEVFWRKDGTCFSVEYYSHPQFLDGKIVGAVVTFTDNTDRKNMEKMLFTEKEHFRTTLLSVGEGVISTDSKGNIIVMNLVAEELTGWSIKEAYGQKLEDVLVTINEENQEVLKVLQKKY